MMEEAVYARDVLKTMGEGAVREVNVFEDDLIKLAKTVLVNQEEGSCG